MTWRNVHGDPIDLYGYSARMQVRASADASDIVLSLASDGSEDGDITLGGAEGTIVLQVEADITADLTPGSYKYDLEVENADGFVRKLLKGKFKVTAEITKEPDV
jgi:hypothetical protein